jgi:hypothetical protein
MYACEMHIHGDKSLTKVISLTMGDNADAWDMALMGRSQEARRYSKSISVLGLATTSMCTWAVLLLSSAFSLTNGGLAGTVWFYLVSLNMYIRTRRLACGDGFHGPDFGRAAL